MFVSMGLSGVVPVLHGIQLYGASQMRKQMGLSWLILQGVLYVLGAGIYAVSFSYGLLIMYTIDAVNRLAYLRDGSPGNTIFWGAPIRSSTYWSFLPQSRTSLACFERSIIGTGSLVACAPR